ncbi:MAG: type I phosphomannose isomerase catalytic subunit [Verrucomicrobiota bacterium]
MLYPFTFQPIFKERIWGGRNIERLYKKKLPAKIPIGESWEISDRPNDESVIANGPLAGKSIRWLMENHRDELLGSAKPAYSERFPLLIKILDAQEKLSLQVHPPAAKAAQLGGEPKTEMWYITDATSEADLFVGLKRGTTRADFEKRIQNGSVAECFHRIPVKKGDAMFLPSGRVHAIGAGNVIFEIQQNSDTTYRVFDWNRVDAQGQPRELHIEQSLASIDFNDIEPNLIHGEPIEQNGIKRCQLVLDPLFAVDLCEIRSGESFQMDQRTMQIIGVLEGEIIAEHEQKKIVLGAGQFGLIPASLKSVTAFAKIRTSFLKIRAV